ncbi:BMP family ABC transporter substrate-binding protein [Deinococcus irradiatisoli]|uniref:BMP family ABC transporter substrate-binding protein n=1 Tax=Deinococcus irradiatisoli TaxID=2202254 RepID=A0A2Z3JRL2_9DEIO|nr:BMP family ABC transporter substrate-binding protein [Deinococcus irradiatisoli]AWN23434.1 BMP family ABC transporter substrate-binding protein [Deinococcus irradiatisoli]
MPHLLRTAAALLTFSLSLAAAQTAPLNVGIALDTGGKNDRSFNQAAWSGAQKAAKEFGVKVSLFSPTESAQGVTSRGAEPLAKAGANLVIGVGFANKDSIEEAARNHSQAKFAVVDDLPTGANTVGLRFREQEGSFMVGYIAGKTSSTGIVGFVGGQDVPLIHKFEAGFAAGVKFICPNCKVIAAYTGKTPAAWNDPATAGKLATSMQKRGADIIFAAAGGSGAGVVAQVNAAQCLKASALPKGVTFGSDLFAKVPKSAAYQKSCAGDARPTFFIGVDSNQNYLGDDDHNPATLNHGLTSMVKRVDNVVYSLIRDVVQKQPWRTGDQSYGLENGGVGYALDSYNRALISPQLEGLLTKVQRLIVFRSISVPVK